MTIKYYFELEEGQSYPIKSQSQCIDNINYKVKIKLLIKPPYSLLYYQSSINHIIKLQTLYKQFFVKLQQVEEIQSKGLFILIYEYLPLSIHHKIIGNQKINLTKILIEALNITQTLIQKGICPELNANLFRLDHKKQLKYLLLPNFNRINIQKSNVNSYLSLFSIDVTNFIKRIICPAKSIEEYDRISDRTSEKKYNEYNKKFQERISFFQNKLFNNRNKLSYQKLLHHKFKKPKKFSSILTQKNFSISSSSSHSNHKDKKTSEGSKNIEKIQKRFLSTKSDEIFKGQYKELSPANIQWISSIQNLIQKNNKTKKMSYSGPSVKQIQDNQNNHLNKSQKLTNSLIIDDKNQQNDRLKHHKSSFGDYSNYATQNQKSFRLKTRVSSALQKSQFALAIFERLQKKSIHKIV